MQGNRRAVSASLYGLHTVTWSADGPLAVLSDMPTSRLVTLDYASGTTAATRYVGVTPKAGAATVKLAVPYIHQVIDTAPEGDGNWACGPTSVAMSLAYFGKLEPWQEMVAGERLSAAAPQTTTMLAPLPPLTPSVAEYSPTRLGTSRGSSKAGRTGTLKRRRVTSSR